RARADKGLRAALDASDPRATYAEMHRVVRHYLSERFAVSSGTARERLRGALLELGAAAKAVDALLVELDNCDFARFAPGGHLAKEAEMTKDRLRAIIAELDRTPRRSA